MHAAHHCHHHHDTPVTNRFIVAIVINLIYVLCEFYFGFYHGSVALLADAGHNLSDVGGLLISLTAFFMLRKQASATFTYGYKKATVLASFLNSLILLGAVIVIVYESIGKLIHGSETPGLPIIITAGIGILINGLTVILLAKGREHDLNVKSAYLHMLSDTFVSVGVVISGGIIMLTNWNWIDPLIGLVIGGLILWTSWDTFKESVVLVLEGVPHQINLSQLESALTQLEHVTGVHHLHAWALSTTENALTAHIKLDNIDQLEPTKERVKALLHQHHIHHSTLEFETGDDCQDSHC